jgi:hypothetical protein
LRKYPFPEPCESENIHLTGIFPSFPTRTILLPKWRFRRVPVHEFDTNCSSSSRCRCRCCTSIAAASSCRMPPAHTPYVLFRARLRMMMISNLHLQQLVFSPWFRPLRFRPPAKTSRPPPGVHEISPARRFHKCSADVFWNQKKDRYTQETDCSAWNSTCNTSTTRAPAAHAQRRRFHTNLESSSYNGSSWKTASFPSSSY